MLRMILEKPALVDPAGTERIGVNDLNDLVQLYSCRSAEEKDGTFFLPAQVADGIYFGIREHGRLVAVAWTPLVNPAEKARASGYVDFRPHGPRPGVGSRGITPRVAEPAWERVPMV